ncbi:MAG TPA: CheR family methyltransferase [Candidatus Binatia bacterium]
MKAMSEREFSLYRKLIYSRAGICLSPPKKALLEARLGRRLRELDMESFLAYYEYATADSTGNELVLLLDRVSTNETHFFREPKQFEFLEHKLLPTWISEADTGLRPPRIRVWSAGCSTGEEPYSLAMILADHLAAKMEWKIEIIGTDLSSRAIASAQKALWPIEKAKEIPDHYLKRFMLKGTGSQAAHMKAGAEIRSMVRFQNLNLNDEHYAVSEIFDLIFCRNVMIYFDAESRARIIRRLLHHLAPMGYLFVGHAESLSGVTEQLRHVIPTVYHHAPINSRDSNSSSRLARAAGAVR